ncbi:MAG: hypothetical protein ACW981_11490 [Candidatus Hodarchaeales archaeon]|jgi:hypothetical protein
MIFENQADFVSVTGLINLFIGYLLSFLILISYYKTRSSGTLGLGITIFSATSSWLGGSIAFLIYTMDGTIIADDIYLYLFLWGVGIALPGIVFVTVNIIKRDHLKYWFSLSIVLSIIYLGITYVLYPLGIVNKTDMVKINYLEGSGLQESSFAGFHLLYAFVLILTGIIFGLLLIRYGLVSTLPEIRFRGFFMGLGLIIFAISSIVDALIENSNENVPILVTFRIFIAIGLIILTIGLLTPNFIKNRFLKS